MQVKINTPSRLLDLNQVSFGTMNQIYFALRMAAGEMMAGGEELPIILDEPFAMYDDERLEAALRWLHDSAGRLFGLPASGGKRKSGIRSGRTPGCIRETEGRGGEICWRSDATCRRQKDFTIWERKRCPIGAIPFSFLQKSQGQQGKGAG